MAASRYETRDLTQLPIEALQPGEVVLNAEQIQNRVNELAEEIAETYRDQKLILVGLLKGADVFMVHMMEALYKAGFTNFETEYMQVKTRDNQLESSGKIDIIKDIPPEKLINKNVLLVDDIADSLTTFVGVAEHFQPYGLTSFRTLSLLEKPSRHRPELRGFPLDFVGFKIPDVWVEGYGLDSFEYGRGNPDIVKGPTPGALAFKAAQQK
ncbi:MAG: phosphoribosyltransferase family protein [Candidatus Roizmanbacteria bacterium]|nr:phosphoribosyltransferase family protein [Candidatus Roizmanbacteria bacterium]